MIIKKLKISNLRNIETADLTPGPALNLVIGDNGAGKTSLIEAVVLLAKGRSFRGGHSASLIGTHAESCTVVAEIESHTGITHRLGLQRFRGDWKARIDGEERRQLSDLSAYLPLALMEPNSHQLVSDGPELRRRFLDWGVFHVKHGFLDDWRHYNRALKQRNAALRAQDQRMARVLEPQLVEYAARVDASRSDQVERLAALLNDLLPVLSPGLVEVTVSYYPGWRDGCLDEVLAANLDRDLERGVTVNGPHRADLVLRGGSKLAKDRFSRGEQKVLAAALILAQAVLMSDGGNTPVLLLDDLASELDQAHLQRVVKHALELEAQVIITGVTAEPYDFLDRAQRVLFHVKHGRVEAAERLPGP